VIAELETAGVTAMATVLAATLGPTVSERLRIRRINAQRDAIRETLEICEKLANRDRIEHKYKAALDRLVEKQVHALVVAETGRLSKMYRWATYICSGALPVMFGAGLGYFFITGKVQIDWHHAGTTNEALKANLIGWRDFTFVISSLAFVAALAFFVLRYDMKRQLQRKAFPTDEEYPPDG
jgi:hypothetical protein